jgi:hypothetical protein
MAARCFAGIFGKQTVYPDYLGKSLSRSPDDTTPFYCRLTLERFSGPLRCCTGRGQPENLEELEKINLFWSLDSERQVPLPSSLRRLPLKRKTLSKFQSRKAGLEELHLRSADWLEKISF